MKKLNLKLVSLLLIVGISMSSCASIVSKSKYPVSIASSPEGAKIIIIDKKGKEVFQGTTPANVTLNSGCGFFGKASYVVSFEKEGYKMKKVPINFKLDGWYLGNIVFGGFIGLLIVDPATGAMYKLDTPFINETLEEEEHTSAQLNVLDINNIPKEWKEHLVLVK